MLLHKFMSYLFLMLNSYVVLGCLFAMLVQIRYTTYYKVQIIKAQKTYLDVIICLFCKARARNVLAKAV